MQTKYGIQRTKTSTNIVRYSDKGKCYRNKRKKSGVIWENAWIILSLQMTHWCLTKSDDGSILYRIFRNVYCSLYRLCRCTTQLSTEMSNGRYFLYFSSLSSLKIETMFDFACSLNVQYQRFDILSIYFIFVKWKQLYHLGPLGVSKAQSVTIFPNKLGKIVNVPFI